MALILYSSYYDASKPDYVKPYFTHMQDENKIYNLDHYLIRYNIQNMYINRYLEKPLRKILNDMIESDLLALLLLPEKSYNLFNEWKTECL